MRFTKDKGEIMNYFELINKCLIELNYKQVNAFSELVKNDHKKIKNILQLLNSEISNYQNWDFKLRKTTVKLPANTTEIENSINGRIASIIIDGHVYKHCEQPEYFELKIAPPYTYGSFNEKILLPKFDSPKLLNIIYYTKNSAIDENGEEKLQLENATDKPLIPAEFAEAILVYGTCLRLKANPQHVKFSYWMGMYNQALANLKSKTSINANSSPSVIMHRY